MVGASTYRMQSGLGIRVPDSLYPPSHIDRRRYVRTSLIKRIRTAASIYSCGEIILEIAAKTE